MKYRYYEKILACIKSCETHQQLTSCIPLIRTFNKKFNDYTITIILIEENHRMRLKI